MKPKIHVVLDHCLESGIEFGLNRAYKHDDSPSREAIKEHIYREIMNHIYDWFDFDEETAE